MLRRNRFGNGEPATFISGVSAGSMDDDFSRQGQMIEENRREYGYYYDRLRFPTAAEALAAEAERAELLGWLEGHALVGCNATKIDCRNLSPGCRVCAEGSWSCLFVNGRCNCSCFYCPTPQDQAGVPVTNSIAFPNPVDYADYLNVFGFSGASISGGEPLLTPERTLEFLAEIRKRCGDRLHLWLYTNGTLLTRDLCRQLRAAGLDEIRFDIGATRYNLKKLSLAVGVIPTVTVEIPAVPEDFPLLRDKLREMADAGVNHLNLHQLRLTPHNFRHLVTRDYTFIHGEKVTVLESELTALRLVRCAIEQGGAVPVNYCSFPYKRRFQHGAVRRRAALLVREGYEHVTECGYLRSMTATGASDVIQSLAEDLRRLHASSELWKLSAAGDGLRFAPVLWPVVRHAGVAYAVSYHEAAIAGSGDVSWASRTLRLGSGRTVLVARRPVVSSLAVTPAVVDALCNGTYSGLPSEILPCETIPAGPAKYF